MNHEILAMVQPYMFGMTVELEVCFRNWQQIEDKQGSLLSVRDAWAARLGVPPDKVTWSGTHDRDQNRANIRFYREKTANES